MFSLSCVFYVLFEFVEPGIFLLLLIIRLVPLLTIEKMPLHRLDTAISASTKQESDEGSRLFKVMAKPFSKRWAKWRNYELPISHASKYTCRSRVQ
jgi:hypothetical protein